MSWLENFRNYPMKTKFECTQIYIVIATLEGLAIVIFEDDGATFSLFATSAAVDDLVFLVCAVEEEGAAPTV